MMAATDIENAAILSRRSAGGPVAFLITIPVYSMFIFYLNLPVYFTLASIVLFSTCVLGLFFGPSKWFGIKSIFYVFNIFFFCIIPALEMNAGVVHWDGPLDVFDKYSITVTYSIVLVAIFEISYRVFYISGGLKLSNYIYRSQHNYNVYLIILFSFMSAIIIYAYNGFLPQSVMLRSGYLTDRVQLTQTQWLIYQYFIYPIPTISFIIYLNYCKRASINTLILLFIFIFSNPITGMARFQAASLYIAVFLSLYPSLIKHKVILSTLLIIGLIFIFPALDIFRFFGQREYGHIFSTDFLYNGTFDSFQSFARVIGNDDIITYGRQLLGSFLFFIPRSLWAEKPYGSGAFVAEEMDLNFSNIAINYMAEGYINFGILGSILFIIFAAYISSRMDKNFYKFFYVESRWHKPFYLIFIGLSFFIMRGDLLSSVSYALGHLAATIALTWLTRSLPLRR